MCLQGVRGDDFKKGCQGPESVPGEVLSDEVQCGSVRFSDVSFSPSEVLWV